MREALAEYLGRARGPSCDAEQIVIVNGCSRRSTCWRQPLDPGDAVVVEEPHDPRRQRADLRGRCRRASHQDSGGRPRTLIVSSSARAPERGLPMSPPCHQFPTGVIMPPSGARAARSGCALEPDHREDDYISECRVRRPAARGAARSLDQRRSRGLYVDLEDPVSRRAAPGWCCRAAIVRIVPRREMRVASIASPPPMPVQQARSRSSSRAASSRATAPLPARGTRRAGEPDRRAAPAFRRARGDCRGNHRKCRLVWLNDVRPARLRQGSPAPHASARRPPDPSVLLRPPRRAGLLLRLCRSPKPRSGRHPPTAWRRSWRLGATSGIP